MRRFVAAFACLMCAVLAGVSQTDPAGAGGVPAKLPALVPANDGLARAVADGELTEAQAALHRARGMFQPRLAARAAGAAIAKADAHDATLIMRDLLVRRGQLSASERSEANALLARPTDGASDPAGTGWTGAEAGNSPLCGTNLCVHWTATAPDAPDLTSTDGDAYPDWVEQTLAVAEDVWSAEIDTLGYRAPKDDTGSTNNGGDGRSDIYLANIDDDSLYGYCTSDDPDIDPAGGVFYASGYCVYDDDFAAFGGDPLASLQATAAHEFFHAVQFGYDAFEDAWLMEGTAMWVEDVVYDSLDSPVPYLAYSQLRNPVTSLDSVAGLSEYGSWLFFQFLTERKSSTGAPDPSVIKQVWDLADSTPGASDLSSMQAVRAVSATSTFPFSAVYADFAVWNRNPSLYDEGASYPAPVAAPSFTLGPSKRSTGWLQTKLNHLTNAPALIVPGAKAPLQGHLTVDFDLPNLSNGSAARLLIRFKSGAVTWKRVKLSAAGNASVRVGFGRSTVRSVTVIPVNGSSRYTCWQGTNWSCMGVPLDQNRLVLFRARLS